MKFIKSKKALVLLAVSVVAVVAAVAGYAYWTASGAGSGSALNATSNGSLVLHADFDPGLTPGASEAVAFSADNAGTSNLFVGTITPTISVSNAYDATTNPNGCKASWFTLDAASYAENTEVDAGATGTAMPNGATLTFNDSTTENQDGCKHQTVTLTLAS